MSNSQAPRRPWLIPTVLGVLVAVVAVAVGVFGWQSYSDSQARQSKEEALGAARTATTQVLSYNASTLDADVAKSRKLVSGGFAVSFEQLVSTVMQPVVKQAGLSNKAAVARAAVIDARPDQVETLLFVKQTSTAPSQPQPTTVMNQIKVTVTKADGQWLISNMQPL